MEVDSGEGAQQPLPPPRAAVDNNSFVTQWDSAGEHITRRKTARPADNSNTIRVTETRYAALSRDDISALQVLLGLSWADLIDEGKPRPVFWEPYTLKLDFIPRVDVDRPANFHWAMFTRIFPTFNAKASRFFREELHEEIQNSKHTKRGEFCALFWAKCSQPDPINNPGSLDWEYGLTDEDAGVHKMRTETLSPVVPVQNPHVLLYALPYFRIEGRLTRN